MFDYFYLWRGRENSRFMFSGTGELSTMLKGFLQGGKKQD